jgi:hypothetical protein
MKTRGGSMLPLIRSGSFIQVEPVQPEGFRWGEVIVYRTGDAFVAHRLVGKQGQGQGLRLLSKGDAYSWQAREEVEPERVVGRVTSVRGRWGEIRIDSGWGRMLSLALAATWPIPQRVFLLLIKLKAGLARLTQVSLDPKT